MIIQIEWLNIDLNIPREIRKQILKDLIRDIKHLKKERVWVFKI